MKLSPEFYKHLEKISSVDTEDKKMTDIFKRINWSDEAQRCHDEILSFFESRDISLFQDDNVGVIDIRWNEYGGDIEVDFMPENDLDTAFDEGCIMNNSAIDNDSFFELYFGCSGENSFGVIDADYTALITLFYYIFIEIIDSVVETEAFQKIPRKDPYYVTFASFHDDEPDVIFDSSKSPVFKKS